ncbi:hypothetical protein ACXYMO_15965 [Arenibacterium sp. CAU 1754]
MFRILSILGLVTKVAGSDKTFFWKYCVFLIIALILYLVVPSGQAGMLLASTVPPLALMPFIATVLAYIAVLAPAAYAISHKAGTSRILYFCASGALLLGLAFGAPMAIRAGLNTTKLRFDSAAVTTPPAENIPTAELIGFTAERRCQRLCRSLLVDRKLDWVRVIEPTWRNPRADMTTFGLGRGDACLNPDAEFCIQILPNTTAPAQLIAELKTIDPDDQGPFARQAARFQDTRILEIRNKDGEVFGRRFELIARKPKMPAVPIKDLFSSSSFDPVPIFLYDEMTMALIDAPATFADLGLVPKTVAEPPKQDVTTEGHSVERKGTVTITRNDLRPSDAHSQYIKSLLDDPGRVLTPYEKVELNNWISLLSNVSDWPPHMVDLVAQVLADDRFQKKNLWVLAEPMAGVHDLGLRILPLALDQIALDRSDAKSFASLVGALARTNIGPKLLAANSDAYFRVLQSADPELRRAMQPLADLFPK